MLWVSAGAVAVQRGVDAQADALPLVAQVLEPSFALRRYRVIDALAAVHALAARLQRAAFLERVQHGIDHAFAEPDGFGRDEAHRFHYFVTVHLAAALHSQNDQLRHAGQERRIRLCHDCDDRPNFVYWPVRSSSLIRLSFRARIGSFLQPRALDDLAVLDARVVAPT